MTVNDRKSRFFCFIYTISEALKGLVNKNTL